ncbi:MAG: hypothetical protein BalsKO_07670 [Balneolaceae bacterium]
MSKQIRFVLVMCCTILLTGFPPLLAFSNIDLENATLSGQVIDSEGEPLPGVNVVVKGTIVGTPTDTDADLRLLYVKICLSLFSFRQ